ncbi:MAG: hypothetical protein AAFO93_09795 [Pseudomonadota bacterium]
MARAQIEGLILRAARGAGVDLAHAEDVAHAVAWWGDADTLRDLAASLTEDVDRSTCRLGPGLIDQVQATGEVVEVPACCSLNVMRALCAAHHAQGGRAVICVADAGLWQLSCAEPDAPPVPPKGRPDVPQDVVAALTALAANTYVPSTAESHAAGAGAGTTDND